MANRRSQPARLGDLADQLEHLGLAAQPVGHEAAGNHHAVKIAGAQVVDRRVGHAWIAVLADVMMVGHERRRSHANPFLPQPQLRIPELEVFVLIVNESEQVQVGQRHDGIL